MKTALVVPSIRKKSINDFLGIWNLCTVRQSRAWDIVIVVEDNPEKTFFIDVDLHVSWKEIEDDLGLNSWIISRRDSAIRSYGFWLAYKHGYDVIFTLDDDCLPVIKPGDFVSQHLNNLQSTPKWASSIPNYRVRGLPYHSLGLMDNVKLSVGLWEGVPDLDAIHQLTGHQKVPQLPETKVMPSGQYFPICGMNMAFRRELVPLCYFPLMGEGQPFRRFDDIWFGVICKKVMDHLGWAVTCGQPYIHHSKASNPFVNLVKEAPGVAFNEQFWDVIDKTPLIGTDPIQCMGQVGAYLQKQENDYLIRLGKAINVWSELFSNP